MIGVVTAGLEARVRLNVRGTGGIEVDLEAVVDTGFTSFLSLPQTIINALALPLLEVRWVVLADGSETLAPCHEATVVWDGHDRAVRVYCLECSPLIGMSLIRDHLLSMAVVDGGSVSIQALP
jgi:clan AA aspartic protease